MNIQARKNSTREFSKLRHQKLYVIHSEKLSKFLSKKHMTVTQKLQSAGTVLFDKMFCKTRFCFI